MSNTPRQKLINSAVGPGTLNLGEPRPYVERVYATPATHGSKEGRRRAQQSKIDLVLAYCYRHNLPSPTTVEEFRRLDRLEWAETLQRLRDFNATLRAHKPAGGAL